MSQKIFNRIKRQNGEAFAQTIRNHHSAILEVADIVAILRHAGRGAEDAQALIPYLLSLAFPDKIKQESHTLDPFILLSRAGYDAFVADTAAKKDSIRTYFRKGELLCTFNDATRHKNYYIIHAVKHGADQIAPCHPPRRQDIYGTSVISIQIPKRGGSLKITNRYNHSVNDGDNTFQSNPDNIIYGLSAALKDYFDVDFTAPQSPVPDGFRIIDKCLFKYHREIGNVFFGDQAWIENGVIRTAARDRGDALFDNYYFDGQTKTMRNAIHHHRDSFPAHFNRYYGGDKHLYVRDGNLMHGDHIMIGADQSRIRTLHLPAFKEIGDDCLMSLDFATHLAFPGLQKMGEHCFYLLTAATHLEFPSLREMGDTCFVDLRAATHLEFPSLQKMGRYCSEDIHKATRPNFKSLKTTGMDCFFKVPIISKVYAFSRRVLS